MSSISHNKSATLPPSPKSSPAPRHAGATTSASRRESMIDDAYEQASDTASTIGHAHNEPNPLAPQRTPTTSQATSTRVKGPSDEQQIDIDAAKNKPLAELVRSVSQKTSGSRALTKNITIAGLGVAAGLLLAGQSFAVVLVIPAFMLLGIGAALVMRSFQNSKFDADIEAFKHNFGQLSAEDKALPEHTEALKLYVFLTDKKMAFAKTQLAGLSGKLTKLVTGMSAKINAAVDPQTHKVEDAEVFDKRTSFVDPESGEGLESPGELQGLDLGVGNETSQTPASNRPSIVASTFKGAEKEQAANERMETISPQNQSHTQKAQSDGGQSAVDTNDDDAKSFVTALDPGK